MRSISGTPSIFAYVNKSHCYCSMTTRKKLASKPGKKQKENPLRHYGAPGKVKDEKEIREEYREDKTETAYIWVWRWGDPCEVVNPVSQYSMIPKSSQGPSILIMLRGWAMTNIPVWALCCEGWGQIFFAGCREGMFVFVWFYNFCPGGLVK